MITATDDGMEALYSALCNAACTVHHAGRGHREQATAALRTATRHAGHAFPAGSPEAAALAVVLCAVGDAAGTAGAS